MSRYIDADELWKEIESVEYYGRDAEVSRICGLIQSAPTAEVKPIIYGEWEYTHDTFSKRKCKECGYTEVVVDGMADDFCPNCGVTMKKEKTKNDKHREK